MVGWFNERVVLTSGRCSAAAMAFCAVRATATECGDPGSAVTSARERERVSQTVLPWVDGWVVCRARLQMPRKQCWGGMGRHEEGVRDAGSGDVEIYEISRHRWMGWTTIGPTWRLAAGGSGLSLQASETALTGIRATRATEWHCQSGGSGKDCDANKVLKLKFENP